MKSSGLKSEKYSTICSANFVEEGDITNGKKKWKALLLK